jgi:hypothetical protein
VLLGGIWFSRFRPVYKGSDTRLGPLALASAAFILCSWGGLLVWLGFNPRIHNISFAWFIVPFICGVIGMICDSLSESRKQGAMPSSPDIQTVENKKALPTRLCGLILAVFLGDFLYVQARSSWINYWLLDDGKQGVAVVTHELWSGHGIVGYKYTVGGIEYTGKSRRNSEDVRYQNVKIGDKSVVYFSNSHPWLSLLEKPRMVIEVLPVIIIASFIELFAVISTINPESKWALNLSGGA